MPGSSWRQELFARITGPWDLVIIGGGITGAGVFREATSSGLRTLLLEQRDFAWGTSSRSGKLVHGGLRYLKQGQISTTRHSVRERERLLKEAPGLVEPLSFLLPISREKPFDKALFGAGLFFYDLLAGRKTHRYYHKDAALMLAPHIAQDHLRGCYCWEDAQADDARMVLRLIFESIADRGVALNYAGVEELLTDRSGRVASLVVTDQTTGQTAEVRAKAVINAAGAWSDRLRRQVGGQPVIRPLRGSHLVFPGWRLPVAQAVSYTHPADSRPIYVFPWEGITLVGTTDLDHPGDLDEEPAITSQEVEYLLNGVRAQFPGLEIRESDVIATFAGVRPVVGTGKKDPSKESREMFLLDESGLVTITGGKLTTFRLLALEAIRAVSSRLSLAVRGLTERRVFKEARVDLPGLRKPGLARRLAGRYGNSATLLVDEAPGVEFEEIPGTPYVWAELRHAAGHEYVVHLDDLLLRRVRLGLLLPDGGLQYAARMKAPVAAELGWDNERWEAEVRRYEQIWRKAYGPVPV